MTTQVTTQMTLFTQIHMLKKIPDCNHFKTTKSGKKSDMWGACSEDVAMVFSCLAVSGTVILLVETWSYFATVEISTLPFVLFKRGPQILAFLKISMSRNR
jgi:hypothetical protein